MKSFLIGTTVPAVLVALVTARAQNLAPASGASIVAQVPCPFTSFEEQSAFTRRFYSKDEFETAKNSRSIDCLKIQYISDGLKVVAFVVRPTSPGIRYPV